VIPEVEIRRPVLQARLTDVRITVELVDGTALDTLDHVELVLSRSTQPPIELVARIESLQTTSSYDRAPGRVVVLEPKG
jgi:hypothetical protein